MIIDKKIATFTKLVANLADKPNATMTAAELKAWWDSSPEELRVKLNGLIDDLLATLDGASGADNIGTTAITSLDGTTIQALLESLRNKLKSITDGSSGADFVNATAIAGLTGSTVQSLLEALKAYADLKDTAQTSALTTHKTSSDHDGRYFTETELQSIVDANSGADKVGATAITDLTGTTVQTLMESLKTLVDGTLISPINTELLRQSIINGAFDIWQRGTSFAVASGGQYTADRWFARRAGGITGGAASRQTGEKSRYCIRLQRDSSDTSTNALWIAQLVETANVIPLRGQKLTVSFRARKGVDYSQASDELNVNLYSGTDVDGTIINSGGGITGGSAIINKNAVLTTSWQDFSYTTSTVLGSSFNLLSMDFFANFSGTAGTNDYVEIEQIQVCAGETSLPFQPRSYGEEESASVRYNNRLGGDIFTTFGTGFAFSTTQASIFVPLPKMRIVPTLTTSGNFRLVNSSGSTIAVTGISLTSTQSRKDGVILIVTVASGITGGNGTALQASSDVTAYINLDAEL